MDQSLGRSFTINRASPQYNGLVSLWTCFGQNRGVVALRDEISHFDMTAFNTPTISNSLFGPVVLFDDAATEYLEIATPLLSTPPFTFTCWFNSDTFIDQTLMSITNSVDATQVFELRLRNPADNDVIMNTRAAAGSGFAATTASYILNMWHLAVGVSAAANSRAVYLDGGNKGTNADNRVPANVDTTSIGRKTGGQYMSGMIGEARLYNRALTDGEVWSQYAPSTRWDLYKPTPRAFFMGPTAVIRTPRYGFTNFQMPGIV